MKIDELLEVLQEMHAAGKGDYLVCCEGFCNEVEDVVIDDSVRAISLQ